MIKTKLDRIFDIMSAHWLKGFKSVMLYFERSQFIISQQHFISFHEDHFNFILANSATLYWI